MDTKIAKDGTTDRGLLNCTSHTIRATGQDSSKWMGTTPWKATVKTCDNCRKRHHCQGQGEECTGWGR